MSRPNVLVVICDDLNDAVEGWGGHPQTQTPNLTRLAASGTAFLNAHCNAPVCAPSRASLWSGLLPQTTGCHDFTPWQKYPTLARATMLHQHFRDSGYRVFGTGKIFHNGHEDYTLYDEFGYHDSFGPFPRRRVPDSEEMLPHPALNQLIDTDPGIRTHWEQTFGPLSDVPDSTESHGWSLYGEPFHYASDDDRDLLPDELSARWAAEILRRRHEQPFALFVGFTRPHTPLYAPGTCFDRFPLESIELRKRPAEPFEPPAFAKALYSYGYRRYELLRAGGGEEMLRRWTRAYLACVSFVDDQLGALLAALESSGRSRDTVVAFTSDNGYHMGEKEQLFKYTLWEESTRVPLVIRDPRDRESSRGRVTDPVSLVDLYPTLCDLCDLPGPTQRLDGTSRAALMRGSSSDPETAAVTARLTDPATIGRQFGVETSDAQFSVRTERWRYTRFDNGEEELYDHHADPYEWYNLAGDPAHASVAAELRERHRRLTSRPR